MNFEWYVLGSTQVGKVHILRIVAGPLSLCDAETEAIQRAARCQETIRFSVVEFDPMFGLSAITQDK